MAGIWCDKSTGLWWAIFEGRVAQERFDCKSAAVLHVKKMQREAGYFVR